MKIVFFGNHLYGHHALAAMIDGGFAPALAVANTPRPGERPWYPSVAELAALHGIPVVRADKVAGDRALAERITALAPDLFVVASFRNIIDADLLAVPARGAVNLHMAPLPRYRGAHPENWAIINGETEMGFTVHYLDESIDSGDVIVQDSVPILPEDDILSLTFKLAEAGPAMLVRALGDIAAGTVRRTPQDPAEASYFPPRKPEDGAVDWRRPGREILDLVRALVRPYPGASTELDGRRLTIWKARPADLPPTEPAPAPGTVIADRGASIVVAAGDGAIEITEFSDA